MMEFLFILFIIIVTLITLLTKSHKKKIQEELRANEAESYNETLQDRLTTAIKQLEAEREAVEAIQAFIDQRSYYEK